VRDHTDIVIATVSAAGVAARHLSRTKR
jgi:hypothetical protein